MGQTKLELLAPAKNLELGKAAINHGADAVYIGADRFGARAAAGNPVADIQELCDYAHKFNARVYLALNTLIFDHELEPARELIQEVWNAGADALIIQDMGLLEMDLPPIPLFASTQTDNQSAEKVKFLEQNGFQRVILARELGISAIQNIRRQTSVDLEVFVHGSLCVCYSGQCYMSAVIGKRSANRGACGQPCRLPWNLVTDHNKVLAENRYLLSLKDMDRSDHLAALAEAGITSFKIEGRLKDLDYVKNITGFYRQRLDALLEGNKKYTHASSGKTQLFFTPDPSKTFTRGKTDYFLFDRKTPIHSFDTPKSLGEKIGVVKKVTPDWLTLEKPHDIHNGDGLCFLDQKGRLKGFHVNRADRDGKLFPPGKNPLKKIPLSPGTTMYRNHDQVFSKILAGKTADRRIGLRLVFSETREGFCLEGVDEDHIRARAELNIPKEDAKNPERAVSTIEKQLGKLGSTIFALISLEIKSSPYFLSARDLNQLRRDLILAMEKKRIREYKPIPAQPRPEPLPFFKTDLDFRANAANHLAVQFYKKRGVKKIAPALEQSQPQGRIPVMTTKHCILYSLDQCPKFNKTSEKQEPLYLENEKARFQVLFNCRKCEMEIKRFD